MIAAHLDRDDFLWALDHSRRRYRVRPTCPNDLTPRPFRPSVGYITVVPMGLRRRVVMRAECGLFPDPWEDSDAYAERRLRAIDAGRTLRAGGGR